MYAAFFYGTPITPIQPITYAVSIKDQLGVNPRLC